LTIWFNFLAIKILNSFKNNEQNKKDQEYEVLKRNLLNSKQIDNESTPNFSS